MTPQEQLNADAENYANDYDDKYPNCSSEHYLGLYIGFKAGATSPTAANGCNKRVEIAKIEFAIKWTESLGAANVDLKETQLYKASIWQLNQQLETLKKQQ